MLGTIRRPSALSARAGRGARVEIAHLLFPLAIVGAVLLGGIVRAVHIFATDFPLNDGGLFYTMVRDLQHARYGLPAYTSYNGAGIPYAYAPIGFYLAGLLSGVTPLSLLDVFRVLPLIVTTATIGAFFLLARAMLPSRAATAIAVFAFALMPRSFIWLLMGGGLTRSLGFFFAILALHQMYLVYTREDEALHLYLAVLFSGLTVLSHLETAKFLAYSAALFLLFYGRHRLAIINSLLVAAGTILFTAPWWLVVLGQHGLTPYRAANATGVSIFSDGDARQTIIETLKLLGGTTSEPFAPLLARLALLGAIYSVVQMFTSLATRRFSIPLLPVWWGAIIILDNRAAATYDIVPMALLVGIGLTEVVLPIFDRSAFGGVQGSPTRSLPPVRQREALLRQGAFAALVAAIIGFAGFSAMTTRADVSGELPSLASLMPPDRMAMDWVGRETPPSALFLVISEREDWTTDKLSEWFPTLTNRASVATPQGYEWMPDNAFIRRIYSHAQVQGCRDTGCLTAWDAERQTGYTYVYVRVPPERGAHYSDLIPALENDPAYALLYAGPGAVVFAHTPPPPSPDAPPE